MRRCISCGGVYTSQYLSVLRCATCDTDSRTPAEKALAHVHEHLPSITRAVPEPRAQAPSIFCTRCSGDGGATGNCPRCGGNGLEPS